MTHPCSPLGTAQCHLSSRSGDILLLSLPALPPPLGAILTLLPRCLKQEQHGLEPVGSTCRSTPASWVSCWRQGPHIHLYSFTAINCNFSVIHCTAEHFTALYYTITALQYKAMYCNVLHCTALHCLPGSWEGSDIKRRSSTSSSRGLQSKN